MGGGGRVRGGVGGGGGARKVPKVCFRRRCGANSTLSCQSEASCRKPNGVQRSSLKQASFFSLNFWPWCIVPCGMCIGSRSRAVSCRPVGLR